MARFPSFPQLIQQYHIDYAESMKKAAGEFDWIKVDEFKSIINEGGEACFTPQSIEHGLYDRLVPIGEGEKAMTLTVAYGHSLELKNFGDFWRRTSEICKQKRQEGTIVRENG